MKKTSLFAFLFGAAVAVFFYFYPEQAWKVQAALVAFVFVLNLATETGHDA